MTIHNLDKVFKPKSIAIVGASDREGSIGYALMRNLIRGEFPGAIYPINPKRDTIWDKPAYPSLDNVKEEVDLVVLVTPISTSPEIVKDCLDVGASGVIIISAGGKEIGEKGEEIEQAIRKEAAGSGLRIIGPNCLGIVNTKAKINASFANYMPLPGKMAFISQSGGICTAVLDLSIREKIGFSYFVSLGSMLDVDYGDAIDYLGNDPQVSSIVMYIESLSRFRNFMSAARAVSRVKPIIALKAGRSAAGAKAASSHTGALAGEDAVYDAAFKRAGIVRVKTFEELFDCAELLAKQPRPSASGLAILTNAGGPGVMAADALSDYDAEPAKLSPETIEKLNEVLPPFWSHSNPIDILGDADSERFRKAAEICLAAPETHGVLLMMAPQALSDPTEVAQGIAGVLKDKKYPVFTSWLGGDDMVKGRDIFNQAGIPTFDTPERAVRAFMDLYRYGKNIEMLQQIPPRLHGKLEFDCIGATKIVKRAMEHRHYLLTETEAKELLSAYGIPVNPTKFAATADDAVKIADDLGYPVVMKIHSRDISHKSEANGVRLNLKSADDVRSTYKSIIESAKAYKSDAVIEGVTVQPMLKRWDYELILGAKKDRDFGPVLLFGMGGILTEVLKDRAIALPPMNRLLARRLMEETKVFRLLKGFRNIPPADLTQLEEILIRLGQLVTDFAEIEELDINPLIASDAGAIAADARILLAPSEVEAPLHLVISPYPNQYEEYAKTDEGIDIFIRPIRPEDAPLMKTMFENLSPQSVYYRFFRPMRELPMSMLQKFTQIDYDREIAMVALHDRNGEEEMLGVARVIAELNLKDAEFSVLVADKWHGKGIGAELLKRCLKAMQRQNIEKVWGIVLPENTKMVALGRKLGFTVKRIPGESEFELKIDLTQTPVDV